MIKTMIKELMLPSCGKIADYSRVTNFRVDKESVVG